MMFWDMDFHTSSSIDEILDKEDVTLEKILDEEDVLQECSTKNKKLTDFLSRDANVAAMLKYITVPPSDETDLKAQFTYPSVAAEILSVDDDSIHDTLVKKEHLSQLWAFFEADAERHPLLASFVVRVLLTLFISASEDMIKLVTEEKALMENVWKHIAIPAVASFFISMATSEEAQTYLANDFHLVERCIDELDPAKKHPRSYIDSIVHIIQEIVYGSRRAAQLDDDIESAMNPLMSIILRQDTAQNLVSHTFSGDSQILVSGLNVLLAMVSQPPRLEDDTEPEEVDDSALNEELSALWPVLGDCTERLHSVITDHSASRPVSTASGTITQSFGALRVSAMKLALQLMRTQNSDVLQQFMGHNTLAACFEYFFECPDNNFLHNLVFDMFRVCFLKIPSGPDSTCPPLVLYGIKDCQLVANVIKLFKKNEEEEARDGGHRLGYMGVLVALAKYIMVLKSNANPEITAALFPSDDDKTAWDEVEPKITALVDLANRPLGGERPTFAMDSDDDDDFYFSTNLRQTFSTPLANDPFQAYSNVELAPQFPTTLIGERDEPQYDPQIRTSYGEDGVFSPELPFNVPTPTVSHSHDWKIDDGEGSDGEEHAMDETQVIVSTPVEGSRATSDTRGVLASGKESRADRAEASSAPFVTGSMKAADEEGEEDEDEDEEEADEDDDDGSSSSSSSSSDNQGSYSFGRPTSAGPSRSIYRFDDDEDDDSEWQTASMAVASEGASETQAADKDPSKQSDDSSNSNSSNSSSNGDQGDQGDAGKGGDDPVDVADGEGGVVLTDEFADEVDGGEDDGGESSPILSGDFNASAVNNSPLSRVRTEDIPLSPRSASAVKNIRGSSRLQASSPISSPATSLNASTDDNNGSFTSAPATLSYASVAKSSSAHDDSIGDGSEFSDGDEVDADAVLGQASVVGDADTVADTATKEPSDPTAPEGETPSAQNPTDAGKKETSSATAVVANATEDESSTDPKQDTKTAEAEGEGPNSTGSSSGSDSNKSNPSTPKQSKRKRSLPATPTSKE